MEMGKYNWDIIKEIKLIEFNDFKQKCQLNGGKDSL